jgi:hypothetical protein
MRSQEIPRAERQAFLDGFAHVHAGWLATLRAPGDVGRHHELPLQATAVAGDAIRLKLGEAEHTIDHPQRLAG